MIQFWVKTLCISTICHWNQPMQYLCSKWPISRLATLKMSQSQENHQFYELFIRFMQNIELDNDWFLVKFSLIELAKSSLYELLFLLLHFVQINIIISWVSHFRSFIFCGNSTFLTISNENVNIHSKTWVPIGTTLFILYSTAE